MGASCPGTIAWESPIVPSSRRLFWQRRNSSSCRARKITERPIPIKTTTTSKINAMITIRPIGRPSGKFRLAGIDSDDYHNNRFDIGLVARGFLMVSTAPTLRRAVSALFLGSLTMIPFFGCHQTYDANATEQFADEKDAPPKAQAKGERFGEEREPLEVKKIDFDAKRAMQYLNQLCAIGTRISGSEGMTKQQELLI